MYNQKKVSVIVPAAGSGKRIAKHNDTKTKKQFLKLEGQPILIYPLQVLDKCELIDEIILVIPEELYNYTKETILSRYPIKKLKNIVLGGKERQDSVYNGLQQVSEDTHWVMVHDGVRPFINENLLYRLLKGLENYQAAILAVPAKDTIKIVINQIVKDTPSRDSLWLIQTPQIFNYKILHNAYNKASQENYYGTDDASLVERLGIEIKVVKGDYNNIKITTPDDLIYAKQLLALYKEI